MLTTLSVLVSLLLLLVMMFIIFRKITGKRLRFSLLTLLLFPIALGFAVLTYDRWKPWHQANVSIGTQCFVEDVAYSPDGKLFACICRNDGMNLNSYRIRIFDAHTLTAIKDISAPRGTQHLRFSEDSKSVLVFDYTTARRVSLQDGSSEKLFEMSPSDRSSEIILDLSSAGDKALVLSSINKADCPIHRPARLRLIALPDGNEILATKRVLSTQGGTLSSDQKKFIGIDGNDLTVLDLSTENQLLRVGGISHPFSYRPELSGDGSRIAVTTAGSSFAASHVAVATYDLNGKELSSIDTCGLHSVFSPDRQRLLVHELGHNSHTLQLWELLRPDGTYDPIHFPELTLAALAVVAFIWSVIRDIRTLRRPTAARRIPDYGELDMGTTIRKPIQ